MQITVEKNGEIGRLTLSGRFDFNTHREFRNACDETLQTPEIKEIEVNFSRVDYLDSSALGMLLLLREKAQSANLKVSLTNCTGLVQQVLDVANFQRLFSIS
ncbi:anti-sigma-factor antagonist [Sulfuricella sp. T08]|uniref:STAS domain-containing protein n=1 Tax=Sulfuricella sp. T08 TaxID=1632857 RepID=UPI0006179598|nr:STAS domain-containing protein [Sulfuricella sp. T08]GAO35158.1 anti-sigma-factor antagonist [Sulfuricella sp. T08]